MKVTIITPATPSRSAYMERLQGIVDSQILDEDTELEWRVNYDNRATIGAKRNQLCAEAMGDVIVHFDSDDWYHPSYIQTALNSLQKLKADVTGLANAWFYNEVLKKAWLYQYKGKQPYVIGSGMMYWRKVWERNPFPDTSHGEDMRFLANAGHIRPHGYERLMYAEIHSDNTCSQQIIPVIRERNISEFNELFGK